MTYCILKHIYWASFFHLLLIIPQVSTFHATEEYIQEPDIKINNAQEGKDDVPDTNLLENKVDIKLDINEDDIDSKTQLKNTKSQDLIVSIFEFTYIFHSDVKKISLCLQAFVRESCKANLDVQVPLTWQPEDRIQTIIDSCIQEFPGYCGQELARKRIGAFLKNCRKTEKRKTTPRVRKEINKKKVKPAPPVEKPSSPWAVVSLRVFLHYNCPCCDFKCKSESNFMDHACEYHPESVDYLYCLDLDQDDEEVHDNFQDDFGDYDEVEFPWNANAIVDIKEEDRELNFNQMVDEAEDDADKDQKQKVKFSTTLIIFREKETTKTNCVKISIITHLKWHLKKDFLSAKKNNMEFLFAKCLCAHVYRK